MVESSSAQDKPVQPIAKANPNLQQVVYGGAKPTSSTQPIASPNLNLQPVIKGASPRMRQVSLSDDTKKDE